MSDTQVDNMADIPFLSTVGNLEVSESSAAGLVLRGKLKAGLYEMRMRTREQTFPTQTLMLSLLEWPSRKTVVTGPFDFDHTAYRMAVPTFRITVNGTDCGLVWCTVPSPEDVETRKIRARWGIRVEPTGVAEIRMDVSEADTGRLRWSDLAELSLTPDDRRPASLIPADHAMPDHPRLFGDAPAFQRLTRERTHVQDVILEGLVASLGTGRDGSYSHRTVALALAGRLTGRSECVAEAIQRTVHLCSRENWGYHDVPDIMGWNNDRDTGMRMFETAIVFDWLHECLTTEQRETIAHKLAHHAAIAYRVTTIQKGYWYYRTAEAHGHGFWLGFAAAAAALEGHDGRAREWLDWIHCNHRDAIRHMPNDGIVEWPVFNAQWAILTTLLLESVRGQPLTGRLPFLDGFARNIRHFIPNATSRPMMATLLFALARRSRDGRVQAEALERAGVDRRRGGAPRALHPLALFAYDPELAPGRPRRCKTAVCAESGTAQCTDASRRIRFTFQCGTPLTARHHEAHNWLSRAWYHVQHLGSFSWEVDGTTVVPAVLKGYRRLTCDANVITIADAGSRVDGRWVGYDIPLSHTGRIEHFATARGVTHCVSDATPGYAPQWGVRLQTRRWLFFRKTGVVVMHDTIETAAPQLPTWHIHATEEWRRDDRAYVIGHGEKRLWVCPLEARLDNDALHGADTVRAETRVAQFVPSYTFGVNCYKTRDWQPEFAPGAHNIPSFHDLCFAPSHPVRRWELITVMGTDRNAMGDASGVHKGHWGQTTAASSLVATG